MHSSNINEHDQGNSVVNTLKKSHCICWIVDVTTNKHGG